MRLVALAVGRVAAVGDIKSAQAAVTGMFLNSPVAIFFFRSAGPVMWALVPQLLLIFDAGSNSANLDSAKAGRDMTVAQYEKAIQTAFREVADAEAARFKLSDLRYRNGVASQLDLLDAQRSLFTAQQAVVQTWLAQLQSQVGVYKTLGVGGSSRAEWWGWRWMPLVSPTVELRSANVC
jgi:outer membrane protein TolC